MSDEVLPGGPVFIQQMPEWELLRRQIIDKAIYFTSQLVFDFRRMLTQSRNAEMAGRLMWLLIKPYAPQVLIGPGFGASALLFSTSLAALADGVELQVLMVRDKRKLSFYMNIKGLPKSYNPRGQHWTILVKSGEQVMEAPLDFPE